MLQDYSLAVPPDPERKRTSEQLLADRKIIDNELQIGIKDINLTDELTLQYRQGKRLLEEVQNDRNVPANQRAQVYNSVGTMLGNIVKMQEVVYSAERLKRYETAFLKAIETLPKEGKEAFFDLYGSFLEG